MGEFTDCGTETDDDGCITIAVDPVFGVVHARETAVRDMGGSVLVPAPPSSFAEVVDFMVTRSGSSKVFLE